MKTLEVFYHLKDVPATSHQHGYDFGKALDFRNAAMEYIEFALGKAGAGEWVGAEIGDGTVSFGFDVQDFNQAETIIRSAVAGTEYDCIGEIMRHELTEEQAAQMPQTQFAGAQSPLDTTLLESGLFKAVLGLAVLSIAFAVYMFL